MAKKEIRDTEENLKNNSKPTTHYPKANPKDSGKQKPNPTRYGDWEKGGRCIDF